VKSGFKDVAHIARDTDLDPLRERADFKKPLAELCTGACTAPEGVTGWRRPGRCP
jgi:hypothetical protein